MKKVKLFIKRNIKVFVAFILGMIISAGGVYAAIVIQGSSVGYTDTYSIGATTVQGAIDKLYTKCVKPSSNLRCENGAACFDKGGKTYCLKVSNGPGGNMAILREAFGSDICPATGTFPASCSDGFVSCQVGPQFGSCVLNGVTVKYGC